MRTQVATCRVSLLSATLWVVVVLGPVLALMALARPIPDLPDAVVVPPPSVGAEGIGETVVAAWLGASEAQPAELLRWFPNASPRGMEPIAASSVTAVGAVSEGGVWAVSVVAQTPDGPRWFTVPLVSRDGGWRALSLPSEIAAPPVVDAPERLAAGLDRPNPSDPLAHTVDGALRALLTGGELSRWTHPTASVSPIIPALYEQVELVGMGVAKVSDDRREVLAAILADGRPMHYSLVLEARGGRWELADVLGAPTLNERTPTP